MSDKNDSLGKRYLFKLVSNFAAIPLFLVMEAVLPRALGPAAYGNFSFATALFLNFTNFFDLGSSTCLNTSLAKRPDEFKLAAFYLRFALIVLLLCLASALIMHLPGAGAALMPGLPLWLAFPAALWAYITWIGRIGRGMNDALGLTAGSESVRMASNALAALLILALFAGGMLDLKTLFAQQYLCLGLAGAGFIFVMRKAWPAPLRFALSKEESAAYTREFKAYCAPLFVIALGSALALSAERWLLQFFEGSVQQGYFSLSQKIGAACILFVTAMTPLLTRELAVAHSRQDRAGMAALLDRYAPMLYAVSAWLSCFILVEAPAVLFIFGGEAYAAALPAVRILALYPIHQGYGQVAAAIFYAGGQTGPLRNLTLWTLAAGLPLAWLLLAPADLFGLGLGATGLALKMTVLQFLSVNLLLYAARRYAPFSYTRNLLHQLLCPLAFLGAALLTARISSGLGGPTDIGRFLASGFAYALVSLVLLLACPFIGGLRRGDLRRLWEKARRRLF
ncbi:MAG: oligosaccharide flippase family protein [Desulfovibrio sp.]|jgi:O-antigen/teichoic acid export membrane protein|nr:oligosaccharide flippase family protein [Desulfovibrio sp.]